MASCWSAFCSTMGLMAGFETLMGIGLRSSYGWNAKQAISAWGPFAIASFLGFATAPKLVDSFNWATLVLFLNPICLAWWALFSIHFTDLSTAVPVWSLYVGMLSTIPNTALSILAYSVIAVRVPPHAQVGANALVQLVGQVGRGIGPLVATAWYAQFIEWHGSKVRARGSGGGSAMAASASASASASAAAAASAACVHSRAKSSAAPSPRHAVAADPCLRHSSMPIGTPCLTPPAATVGVLTPPAHSRDDRPSRMCLTQSGYNAAVLFNLMFIGLSMLPLPFIFTIAYGKLSDPSAAQIRANKATGMM